MPDSIMREDFNNSTPVEDISRFSGQVASVAARREMRDALSSIGRDTIRGADDLWSAGACQEMP
jgi:hypothetical protein